MTTTTTDLAAAQIDAITAVSKTLAYVTTSYVYDLDEPLTVPGYPGRLFVRLAVKVTRWSGATEDPQRTGSIIVTGYHRQHTLYGPRAQSSVGTPARLPVELAAPLITRALTQS